MKVLKYIFVALMLVFSLNSAGFAQMFSFEKNPHQGTATFPAGTFLKGILKNQLSSAENRVGDKVYLLIPFNVKIGKITCIPKNSLITGHVTQVQKAQQGRNGFVQVKFDYIKFPDGWGTSISAHVWNREGKGNIGGESTKKVTYKKIPHYIENIGIVAQLVETGPGVMGQDKLIPEGSEFIIVLDNDLEVKPNPNL